MIYPLVKGKSVLDCGFVEHSLDRRHKQRYWVHDFLRRVCAEVLGVDIAADAVEALRDQGYQVVTQSVEELDIQRQFDVVFAGELIEHLSNPGLFLDRVREHLRDDGLLILTTPNAFSMHRFALVLKGLTNDPPVNPEHTVYFAPSTLTELLHRHGFKVGRLTYANYPVKKPKVLQSLVEVLAQIAGARFKQTMIVVAARSE